MYRPFYNTLEKGGPQYFLDAYQKEPDTTPVSYEMFEERLRAGLADAEVHFAENNDPSRSHEGKNSFSPVEWILSELQQVTSATADLSIVNSSFPVETYITLNRLRDAFSILAYSQLPPYAQEMTRDYFKEYATDIEIAREAGREVTEGDYPDRIELSDSMRPLLKLLTEVAGIPYDGQQTVFPFSHLVEEHHRLVDEWFRIHYPESYKRRHNE